MKNLKSKIILIILVVSLVSLLGGCGLNDQDKYVKTLRVGQTLDLTKMEDAEVVVANAEIIKYRYVLWYSRLAGDYTTYYITTKPDNRILSIWSR